MVQGNEYQKGEISGRNFDKEAIRNEGTDSQSLNPQFRFPFVLVIH